MTAVASGMRGTNVYEGFAYHPGALDYFCLLPRVPGIFPGMTPAGFGAGMRVATRSHDTKFHAAVRRAERPGSRWLFVRYPLLGGLGADSPQRARGPGPASKRMRGGLAVAVALPSLAPREAQGGGSASRCAGLVPHAHLARRALLRRALWGEPARLARGRFAPGLRCAGHFACAPVGRLPGAAG